MFLRRYDLEADVHDNPFQLVRKVQTVIDLEPSPEAMAAAAELAYIGGVKSDIGRQSKQAFNLYGSSVAYSYAYLFNPQFRNSKSLRSGSSVALAICTTPAWKPRFGPSRSKAS